MKLAQSCPKGKKKTVGKGDSYSVFQRPVMQTHINKGLFGKGLNHINVLDMLTILPCQNDFGVTFFHHL